MMDGTSDDVRNVAKKMVSELGGIPLAIDQAGAYIHKSACGIDGYFKLYEKNKHRLGKPLREHLVMGDLHMRHGIFHINKFSRWH